MQQREAASQAVCRGVAPPHARGAGVPLARRHDTVEPDADRSRASSRVRPALCRSKPCVTAELRPRKAGGEVDLAGAPAPARPLRLAFRRARRVVAHDVVADPSWRSGPQRSLELQRGTVKCTSNGAPPQGAQQSAAQKRPDDGARLGRLRPDRQRELSGSARISSAASPAKEDGRYRELRGPGGRARTGASSSSSRRRPPSSSSSRSRSRY